MSLTATRAYRELLKVQRSLFVGDLPALAAARLETRTQFLEHADAKPEEVPELIQDAYNTAGFLNENIAQTVRNDEGNYVLHPRSQHITTDLTPPPMPQLGDVNRGEAAPGCGRSSM